MKYVILLAAGASLAACAQYDTSASRISATSAAAGVDCTSKPMVEYTASGAISKIEYAPLDPRCSLSAQTVGPRPAPVRGDGLLATLFGLLFGDGSGASNGTARSAADEDERNYLEATDDDVVVAALPKPGNTDTTSPDDASDPNTDDGSGTDTGDGSTDDGSTDDGSNGDGSADDGADDNGGDNGDTSADDGSGSDDMGDDGTGSAGDGNVDNGSGSVDNGTQTDTGTDPNVDPRIAEEIRLEEEARRREMAEAAG